MDMGKKNKTQELALTKRGWLGYFFGFSLQKKLNFYWAWQDFMIIIRNKGRLLVIEIPVSMQPYLVQKSVDISHLSHDVIIGSLLYLVTHYPCSFSLLRNKELSVHFLSFISFLQNHLSNNLPARKPLCHYHSDPSLVSYLVQILHFYGIRQSKQQQQQQSFYLLSQLSDVV